MTARIKIPLREILSPSKASELAESIAAGSLTRWHARGPLTLPEARAFLGIAEATLAAPPTGSAH